MLYSVPFLFLIASRVWQIALAQQETNNDVSQYCKMFKGHTMCQFQTVSEKCASMSGRGIDERNRLLILQGHNSLRAILASGKEMQGLPGPQPAASNMQVMFWDEELAKVAQAWADQCNFEHDCNQCRRVERFTVGQNLYKESTTGPVRPANWKKVITGWYDEVQQFANSDVKPFRFSKVTGHYSAIVWAETNRVGCGFTSYMENSVKVNFYVCNYGPGGNLIGGAMYRNGTACSQCPNQFVCSSQFEGLCEPIKKPVAVTLPAPPTAEQPSQAAPATSRPVTGKPEEPTKKPTSQTAAPETPSLPNSFPTGTKKPTVTIDRPSQNPNRPSRPIVFPTRNPQGSPSQPIVFPTRAPVGSSRPGLLPFGISRPGSTPNRPPPVQEDTWSCQVGMAPCSARYQGSPWALVGESDQVLLQSTVTSGQTTKLIFDVKLPSSESCFTFRLRQSVVPTGAVLAAATRPVVTVIQENGNRTMVPQVPDSRWIKVKMSFGTALQNMQMSVQQNGPEDGATTGVVSARALQISIGKLSAGNC